VLKEEEEEEDSIRTVNAA